MDLQDSSALHVDGGGAWKGANLLQIANDLVAPFGMETQLGDAALGSAYPLGPQTLAELSARVAKPFRRFAIEPGERVAATLKRLADERGLMFVPTPAGGLAITLSGSVKLLRPLRRGVNLPAGWVRRGDWRDRYSDYIVVGHAAGDSFYNGAKAQAGRGEATDDQVERYRPIVIVHDGSSSGDAFEARARWERNRRAGTALEFSGPVETWVHDDAVWQPNRIVPLVHPAIGANDDLLISDVELTYDLERGDQGKLTLVHRGAYDPLQKPAKKKKRTNLRLASAVGAGLNANVTMLILSSSWIKEDS
jgi:prophage tail gpP-like protein